MTCIQVKSTRTSVKKRPSHSGCLTLVGPAANACPSSASFSWQLVESVPVLLHVMHMCSKFKACLSGLNSDRSLFWEPSAKGRKRNRIKQKINTQNLLNKAIIGYPRSYLSGSGGGPGFSGSKALRVPNLSPQSTAHQGAEDA